MEFWFSGEDQGDVGESARLACNELQESLNVVVRNRSYGNLVEWALITIILDDHFTKVTGFGEIKKYWPKKQETEFRLKIDHAAFKAADDRGKRRLIFATILRSINVAREMKIPNFDLDRFESDVKEVGRAYGWT